MQAAGTAGAEAAVAMVGNRGWGSYAMIWGRRCGWSKISLLRSYLLLLSRWRRLIVDHVVVGLQHELTGVRLLVQHRLRVL